MPSFEAAIADDADVLEFDIRWTKDDAMVALHDSTLDRTTDCTGPVSSKTLAEVRSCDAGSWVDSKWAGTKVPTMQEVVALAAQHHMRIAPELKQEDVTRGQVAAFAKVIRAAGLESRTVVQSSYPASLQLFLSLDTDIPSAYVTYRSPQTVASVRATGADYYIPDYPSITAAEVAAFQAAGIRVWVYTVKNTSENATVMKTYPDGIITNDSVLTRSSLS